MAVAAGALRIRMTPAPRDWRSWLFALRPRALYQRPVWTAFEERCVRPVVGRIIGGAEGVRAAGETPGGQYEWYAVADYRAVADASLHVNGRSAGPMTALASDLGVGLSAFPTRPAVVAVSVTIEGGAAG